MSKISVWKCDISGKLFEDQVKYSNHLRKLARHRLAQRKLTVVESEADIWWAAAYEQEMTVDEFKQFVIDNQIRFWAEGAKANRHAWDRVGKNGMPMPELLNFNEFSLRWNDNVSNSHSAPYNGVRCWSSHEARDGRPRSYPGWYGRVSWNVKWPNAARGSYLGSDLFKGHRVRVHTGSGGGGSMIQSDKHGCSIQQFGYDFSMFAADWPGMAREVGMNQFTEVLQGTREIADFATME